jgi:hypothetical protein
MPIVVSSPVPQTPATDSQSPDGKIRATVMPSAAGVFIRVDYTSMLGQLGYSWPNPFRITLYRQTEDGVVSPVRGADSISQYGAIFHAYDDEVRFGQQVVYWAEAPTKSGDQIVETDKVAVRAWEPDGGFTSPGVWIKNLENPDLSVPARCLDWSGGSWASRNATADIWGGADPAVTTDVRKSYNTKMTILTKDEDEYQALLEAIDSSVVYIVGLERHRRRTGYYLIGDIAPTRVGKPDSPYDSWDVGLTGMGRPTSAGHSLSVPGRSYADRKRAYATFDDIPYASFFIRVVALTSTVTTRIAVNSLTTVPITPAASYTTTFTMKLSNAAAARNLYAGMSFWDAGNNPLTSITGPDVLVQPGATASVSVVGSSATGVKTRPFATGKNMLIGESFDLIDATTYPTAGPTANILLAADRGPFTTSMGNWGDLGNSTQFLVPGYRRTYGSGTEPY